MAIDEEKIKERLTWLESYLTAQLGYKAHPDSNVKGEVKKRLDEIDDILSGNGKMGLKTKVAIMWWVHGTVWALMGAGGMYVLTQFFG